MNTCVQAAIALLALRVLSAPASADAPPAPFESIATSAYSSLRAHYTRDGADVIISQYGASGNNFDIVALSLRDGTTSTLIRELNEATFLTRDAKHLVVAQRRSAATRLSVFESGTGQKLASINLGDGAAWAHIAGDKLLVIQRLGSWGKITNTALVLDLATLKPLQSFELDGVDDALVWGERVVTIGRELALYDFGWRKTDSISLPALPPTPGRSCLSGKLRLEANIALGVVGCGNFVVFDLAAKKVARVIPANADVYSLDLAQGLIFTVASYARSATETRVFDLMTGKLVAQLPIPGNSVFAVEGRLLTVAPYYELEKRRIPSYRDRRALYSFDAARLRSGEWQRARIASECAAAAKAFESDRDHYAAIDRCEAGGIATLSPERWRDPDDAPLVRSYGGWLSDTFDRYADAIPILEAMQRPEDPELTQVLANAKVKAKLLGGGSATELTAAEKRTAFGTRYSSGSQRLTSTATPIGYTDLGTTFTFSGDRMYVGVGECADEDCGEYTGTTLEVRDRESLGWLRNVHLPVEAGSHPTITSIVENKASIWVITREGEDPIANAVLYEVDRESFEVLRHASIDGENTTLFSEDGELLSCSCLVYSNSACARVDLTTLALSPVADWACANTLRPEPTLVRQRRESLPPFVEAVTPRYFIVRESSAGEGNFFAAVPRSDAPSPPQLDKYRNRSYGGLRARPGSDAVLIARFGSEMDEFLLHDVATGKSRTLARFPEASTWNVDARRLYIALGRDLAIFDFATGTLEHYVHGFTGGDTRGEEAARLESVENLLIDRDRLFAVTMDKVSSVALDLKQLDAAPSRQ